MMSAWIALAMLVVRPLSTSAIVGSASGGDVEVVRQIALWVEIDRQHAHAGTAQKTSASVRTVVVLPVPPFWESTAIVCVMRARYYAS